MSVEVLYLANDNLLELNGLTNKASGAYVNTATVTVTLLDESGAQVAGETWPKTLAYVAASNGNYRATLDDAMSLIANKLYTARVSAVGGGVTGFWETPLLAQKRI